MTTPRLRLVGLFFALMGIVVGCSANSENVGKTPGYSNRERAVGSDEFRLVQPADSGSATTLLGPAPTLPLPPDVEDQVRPMLPDNRRPGEFVPSPMPEPTTTTTTTTTVPAPTTTLPPMYPIPMLNLNSLCGMNAYFQSLVSVFINPDLDRKQTVIRAQQVLKAYSSKVPASLQGDMDRVQAMSAFVTSELAKANYDINKPALKQLSSRLFNRDPMYADFFASYTRLREYEESTCR